MGTSHNTMQKRLCREYKITPREARLLLKASGYNYKLAKSSLFQMKMSNCVISIENWTRAVGDFTKILKQLVNSFSMLQR